MRKTKQYAFLFREEFLSAGLFILKVLTWWMLYGPEREDDVHSPKGQETEYIQYCVNIWKNLSASHAW